MYEQLFSRADMLLPAGNNFKKWCVVACDQFTSEPAYWSEADRLAGDAPSSLRLIVPEAYLEQSGVEQRIQAAQQAMCTYLKDGALEQLQSSFVFVERTLLDGQVRRGLVGKLDLEQYDYSADSQSAVRPTEGTVESRLTSRIQVREGAALELPHIMALIDDPQKTVLEALAARKEHLRPLYDFTLMQGGGRIRGWAVSGPDADQVDRTLRDLFSGAYTCDDKQPVLIAMGDGNHSLATAKVCFERLKRTLPNDQWATHPARWALVELQNLWDDAIQFEPIHRIVTHTDVDALLDALETRCARTEVPSEQNFTCITEQKSLTLRFACASARLTVGEVQLFLDEYLSAHPGHLDYIHGNQVVERLARVPEAVGFLLPPVDKANLFRAVQMHGALPRKTFSIGHAQEKRYYLEARRIEQSLPE